VDGLPDLNTTHPALARCVSIFFKAAALSTYQKIVEIQLALTQLLQTNGASCFPRSAYVYTGWAKLNGANAVSFVAVKHVLENFDNFWQVK